MSSIQSFNSTNGTYYDQNSKSKDEGIDYDFYDNFTGSSNGQDSDSEEIKEGIKEIEIKLLEKYTSRDNCSSDSDKEISNIINNDIVVEDLGSNLTKCIAYETNIFDKTEIDCISKSSSEVENDTDKHSPIVSPESDSILSASTPSSDLTNITPFSSSSSCSSTKDKKYDGYSDDEQDESSKLDMKLLTDAVESMSIKKHARCSPTYSAKSRISNRPRRKNMTFTNEQLRKIDRENEILLKKIMACTKPRPKPITLTNNTMPLRIKASAAINRSKQQHQINHENYLLLKKIHNVKSTQSFLSRK